MTRKIPAQHSREALLRLRQEKRALMLQKEALILLVLALATVLGLILISI